MYNSPLNLEPPNLRDHSIWGCNIGFPSPIGTGKMGDHFSVRNFGQTGKVGEFYPKYWKNMENDLIIELKRNVSWLYVQNYFLALLRSAYLF